MNLILNYISWLFFVFLALCVGYLLFYAIMSKFYKNKKYSESKKIRKFAVLVPAYKEDQIILSTVKSLLTQDYPQDKYNIIVISDRMNEETDNKLKSLPIHLLIPHFEKSSKANSLIYAVENTKNENYDAYVILDADNTMISNFLYDANNILDSGIKAIQACRMGKNIDTDIAILDNISEAINNGFFRSGHNAIGLSSSLAGSGMVFEANWFKKNVIYLHTVGEDKELEALLLKQFVHIEYIRDLCVFDEKTHKLNAINKQRRRWLAVQYGALRRSLPDFPKALLHGNIDYCDKIVQWMLPPRLIQLALVFGLTLIFTIIAITGDAEKGLSLWTMCIKWWVLSVMQVACMLIPIPKQLISRRLFLSIVYLPQLFFGTFINMFKLRSANKNFIHTEHGGKNPVEQ